MLTIKQITDRETWNQTIAQLPYAHILQSWEWGEFKHQTTGWKPHRLAFYRGDALVAMVSLGVRHLGGIVPVMYAPKSPAMDYADADLVAAVLSALESYAKWALWLKIDPDVVLATGVPHEADDQAESVGQQFQATLQARGWVFSADQVQFRNTITLDLTQTEDDLLAAMSQNTRRKVRTAEKKGVTIRAATPADLPLLYALYQETGERDAFLIRPAAYYEQAWRDFMQAGLAHALIAEVDGEPVAHVILYHFGGRCWYFYGASSNRHRDKMPNYLLQWEAIKWAKVNGCTVYDFWGAPDDFTDQDRMWGVFEFKRGFRGTVKRHVGAWDYARFKALYRLYVAIRSR